MSALVVAVLLLGAWVLTTSGRPRVRPAAGAPAWSGWWRRWRLRRAARGAGTDVTRVLVEVATRLRAGTQVAEAWRRSLPEPAPPWAAEVLRAAGAADGSETLRGWAATGPGNGNRRVAGRAPGVLLARWRRRDRSGGQEVAAAVAACRLASRTGAPLAEVIDVVVAGIGEVAEADELRSTALAGPRATARLLAWLPAGGIALGTVLGADPVAVLLGGGAGGLCLVGGGALFLVGHRWVRALVADAERAGT